MKKALLFAKIGIAISMLILIYILISIPGTLQIASEISKLEMEFAEKAQKPINIFSTTTTRNSQKSYLLLYGGELEKIIQKRNQLVQENNAWFWGAWTVSTEDIPGRPLFIKTKTPSLIFKPCFPG